MSDFTNQIFQDIVETLGSDLDLLGEEIVQDGQRAVSTPAPKVKGRWESSGSAGKNPYMRTGKHIHDQFGYEIIRDGPNLILVVYCDSDVARWVNDGTKKMASRPFMDFLFDRWVDKVSGQLLTTFS